MIFSLKKLIPTYMFAEPGGEGFTCPRGQGRGEGVYRLDRGAGGGPALSPLTHKAPVDF